MADGKRRKTIITVQHTQSEHHVNGYIGAQGNWNLTELGKEQARAIGRWLSEREHCDDSWLLYTSDLNRAFQTAEGINETLHIPEARFISTDVIRELNLGEGNGKPREWANAHAKPWPEVYDPYFRSFEGSECDAEMWKRLEPFAKEILASEEEHILVVSHGGALGFLNSMLMGNSFEETRRWRFFGHSGGVTKFIYEEGQPVKVPYVSVYVDL